MKKQCSSCGIQKGLSEFHKAPANKDGLKNSCKLCIKEYHRLHRLKDPEKYRLKAAVSYLEW